MRAIYILLILLIIIISGCTTVEIVKEVSKATNTVKTTIEKISSNKDDKKETEYLKIETEDSMKENQELKKEKEKIVSEKNKVGVVLNKQKKIVEIKILGKTLNQLTRDFGKPALIRKDSNIKSLRFDASSCRLFVYINLATKKSKAEYFEVRNTLGELIDNKENIEKCFKEIRKT